MLRGFAAAVTALIGILAGLPVPAHAQAITPGGVLKLTLVEDLPQGFAIHESSAPATVLPSSPCFNNLVYFDPLKKTESMETIVGDLAERWSWQDDDRSLVFFLRKGVKWHDGQPFSSRDVKFTFDLLREAPDAQAKLRINPRKEWYANVTAVEAPDAHTVVFRLLRPQPSLLMLLASGFSPVYAAHVLPASYRTGCVGTGPFKLKEWRRGEVVEYVKNTEYFIPGRPYLDGLRYLIITDASTRSAALQAGRVDASAPGYLSKPLADQLKQAAPQLVVIPWSENVNNNIIMNIKKPPFDNPKVRLAVSHAIDRRALVKAVYQDGAALGAALAPPPYGVWGLTDKDVAGLPGRGRPAEDKAKARKLLGEAGYGPQNPLKIEIVTRAISVYIDIAAFVVNELRQIGIEATVRQVESPQWHAMASRGDYQIGTNLTGAGADDPDATLIENYACGSPRNYTQYCNEEFWAMVQQQSQQVDRKKRLALVQVLQRKLEHDAARPVLNWRIDYFTAWPYVKNVVPHQSIYNWGRMQEAWIGR
jgi:peptide/nickel transport system substrate-binding protein